jgi:hypothetical protein
VHPPAELDCRVESACETCAYFRTGTQFLPILTRQRDHARDHGRQTGPRSSTGSSNAPQPPNGADTMPGITLDLADAAELAETLALITEWLSGSQKQTLAGSFAAFIGHPAYNTDTLCADLHRFAFLLGASDGEELFGEPTQ